MGKYRALIMGLIPGPGFRDIGSPGSGFCFDLKKIRSQTSKIAGEVLSHHRFTASDAVVSFYLIFSKRLPGMDEDVGIDKRVTQSPSNI